MLRRSLLVVCFITSSIVLSACGNPRLTADSKCIDYIQSDGQTRYDAAIRITTELHFQDAGNPMWEMNLDASCGQQPTRTIREALGKGAVSATNDQSSSPISSPPQEVSPSVPRPTSVSANPSGQIGGSSSGNDAGNGATGGIG